MAFFLKKKKKKKIKQAQYTKNLLKLFSKPFKISHNRDRKKAQKAHSGQFDGVALILFLFGRFLFQFCCYCKAIYYSVFLNQIWSVKVIV
jgi:hypothetical protein